jgi:hypothetical protein
LVLPKEANTFLKAVAKLEAVLFDGVPELEADSFVELFPLPDPA